MTPSVQRVAALSASLCLIGCVTPAGAIDRVVDSSHGPMRVETVVAGLDHPWALAFLPDGALLVTERPGRLRLLAPGAALSDPLAGVPPVFAEDQGGLLDVAIDPDFAANRLVYLSFAEPGPDGTNGTAVARGRLSEDGTALEGTTVIFAQRPKVDSSKHFGSRLVFDGAGHLYVTLGERSDEAFRDQAQDLDSHLGKIVRLFPDGSVPPDNPFVGEPGALPEIWSYGHRNVQAAAINPATGVLWEIEHGPRGGDELNVVAPGANYGWPLVSYGINYWGTPVGTGAAEMPGVTPPIFQWTPVIAPSGMMFYDGDAFPDWQGDLFVGGLRSSALVRLDVDGGAAREAERLIDDLGLRIRDVQQGPDGAIWLVTDEDDGAVLRLSPGS
ncbi:MAG: PQQ-dependent sugar dehydrogenase [Alphaproteobacteria bacterium]